MRLISIRLENYRKFRKAEFELPDGLIGILGLNGAGKSTLFEAITWALYGTHASRTNKELIRSSTADPSDPCVVSISFEREGSTYDLVREMRGTTLSSKARLSCGDAVLSDGDRETSAYVERMLGMNLESFRTSIYTEQKELSALSDRRPHERKAIMFRLLGIERIKEAVSAVRKDLRTNRDRTELLRKQTMDEEGSILERFETELDEIRKNAGTLDGRIKTLDGLIGQLEKDEGKVRTERDRLVKLRESYYTLEREIKSRKDRVSSNERRTKAIGTELKELVKGKDQLPELKAAEKRREASLKRRETLEADRRKLDRRKQIVQQMENERKVVDALLVRKKGFMERAVEVHRSFREMVPEAEDQSGNWRAEWSEAVADDGPGYAVKIFGPALERSQEEIKQVASEIKLLETRSAGESKVLEVKLGERKRMEEQLARIGELGEGAPCPTCLRPLGTHLDELNDRFRTELEKMSGDIAATERQIAESDQELSSMRERTSLLEKQRDSVNGMIADMRDITNNLDNIDDQIEVREKSIAGNEKELGQLGEIDFDRKEYDELQKAIADMEKGHDELVAVQRDLERIPILEKEAAGLEAESKTLETEIKEGEGKLKGMGYDAKLEEKVSNDLDRLTEERTDLVKQAASLRTEKEVSAERAKNLEKRIEEQGAWLKEIKGLEETSLYLNRLEKLMVEFQVFLLGRVRPGIARYASDWLLQLTDGKYSHIQLDEDFNILVIDNGMEFGIDRFSGGEKDVINLCIRLAISRVIAELGGGHSMNFIILDEVFGSQDEVRRRNILEALNRLSGQFRQIFLISHVDDIKDQLSSVMMVEEREDGTSVVDVR